MKGYKVFNPDWTCREFQYEVGKTYEHDGELRVCGGGFHFCEKAVDCFNYYSFDPNNKVAEVEAVGDVLTDGDKSVTNKLVIVREVEWSELLSIVNTGKENTGCRNSGDRNSGYYNSGDRNSGYYNSGDWNSGNGNSGYYNSGDRNSGYYNSGDWNSGDGNSGDWNSGYGNGGNGNSGDWNSTNHSSGVFNSKEEKINLFNKPSEMTLAEFRNSEYARALRKGFYLTEWIYHEDLSEEEKSEKTKTCGGKLITKSYKQAWMDKWEATSDEDRQIIMSMPNFDAEVFCEITGIRV
jgi:hypothetical protein